MVSFQPPVVQTLGAVCTHGEYQCASATCLWNLGRGITVNITLTCRVFISLIHVYYFDALSACLCTPVSSRLWLAGETFLRYILTIWHFSHLSLYPWKQQTMTCRVYTFYRYINAISFQPSAFVPVEEAGYDLQDMHIIDTYWRFVVSAICLCNQGSRRHCEYHCDFQGRQFQPSIFAAAVTVNDIMTRRIDILHTCTL